MLRTRIRNNGGCRQVATPLLDDVDVDVLSLRPKDTKMAGTIQQAKESWARPHCPTPSLHRDESVLHISAAIAQPEPLDNDDRKLVPSPKAHRPTKSPGTWGKEGCISGGNFTGACYTLPPYIAKKNNICPPSPISRRPQGLPRLQQIGCNALLPPTWWYRSPSDVCQALVALSMPVRHAGETLLCRGDSGTRIAPIFDSGAGNVPLSGCRRRCVDASQELGNPSKTLKLFMPTTTQEEANLQPKRGQDIVILGEDDNTYTFLQTSLQTERNWSEQERMTITTILRNTTSSQDL